LVHLCLCSYSEALDNLTVIVNECLVCWVGIWFFCTWSVALQVIPLHWIHIN
jgi:hypothetical protein